MNSKIIFGTDGWRGLAGKEVNEGSVSLVAQAFADYLKSNRPEVPTLQCAVGYDGREHSKDFASLFAEILSGNDIQVYVSESVIPTPVLSYFVQSNGLDAGVMITASHNPPEYNGIKFKADYGGPFFTQETYKVEELLGKNQIKNNSDKVSRTNFLEPYIAHLNDLIDFELINSAGLKIAVDSMAGSGQEIVQSILSKYNCTVTTIDGIPKPDFGGRLAEPIAKNLAPLSDFLSEHPNYAIGLATDGDADRCGVMLNGGSWLNAQDTILLLTDYVVNQKQFSGGVIKTSSVTDKVRTQFESEQRKVYDVQVGFKYICETMLANDVAIGCEESGGYGYKHHIPERDGILSALLFIEMLSKSGTSNLTEYWEAKKSDYGDIHYQRIDYPYTKPDRKDILPNLYKQNLPGISVFKVRDTKKYLSSRGDINGIKFVLEGDCRWLLMRASETEPLIRIYAEGQNEEEVQNLLVMGKSLVE